MAAPTPPTPARPRTAPVRIGLLCLLGLLAAAAAAGCDGPADPEEGSVDPEVSAKASALGIPAWFDPQRVMEDSFFTDTDSIDAADLQVFFENTSTGRSWLADARLNGTSAAEAIHSVAARNGVNPLVIAARMQIESSLVNQSSLPPVRTRDFAFGCGCPDWSACQEQYRGLDRQLDCAAEKMRQWYDRSIDGSGWWRRGAPYQTLDGRSITPANHATASLYAYTPWILEGRGGNWLVWNVTRRYAELCADLGLLDDEPAGETAPASAPADEPSRPSAGQCATYTVPEGGSCGPAAETLGCAEGALVNCTERGAGCADLWPADVLACSAECCP